MDAKFVADEDADLAQGEFTIERDKWLRFGCPKVAGREWRPARTSFTLEDFVKGSPAKHLLCWRRELALELGELDETIPVASDDYDFPWTLAERGATFMASRFE